VDDPLLRRIERTAVVACGVMAAVGFVWAGLPAAAGVVGGGVLAAVSYASLASGVSALTTAAERVGTAEPKPEDLDAAEEGAKAPGGRPRKPRPGGRTLAKVALRYALLILLAYVMIARLRLHPVAVLAGLSSVVVAAGIEALRIVVKKL
jgi:hypothetical protein